MCYIWWTSFVAKVPGNVLTRSITKICGGSLLRLKPMTLLCKQLCVMQEKDQQGQSAFQYGSDSI